MLVKRINALILVLVILCTTSSFASAREIRISGQHNDCFHENDDANWFDWSEYVDRLGSTEYCFVIHASLSNEASEIVLFRLIREGIVPQNAYYRGFADDPVFIHFMDNNVTIEYFGGNIRAVDCCENMKKAWKQASSTAASSYGTAYCKHHCWKESYTCQSCEAIWDTRVIQNGGCGKLIYASGSSNECIHKNNLCQVYFFFH